jgi:hypothetical protein
MISGALKHNNGLKRLTCLSSSSFGFEDRTILLSNPSLNLWHSASTGRSLVVGLRAIYRTKVTK